MNDKYLQAFIIFVLILFFLCKILADIHKFAQLLRSHFRSEYEVTKWKENFQYYFDAKAPLNKSVWNFGIGVTTALLIMAIAMHLVGVLDWLSYLFVFIGVEYLVVYGVNIKRVQVMVGQQYVRTHETESGQLIDGQLLKDQSIYKRGSIICLLMIVLYLRLAL